MDSKFLICVALTGVLIGCSKKDETVTPPPAASRSAMDKTDVKTSPLDQAATNTQAAAAAIASNGLASATSVVADATNASVSALSTNVAAARNAVSSLGGAFKSTAQDTIASATNLSTPAVAVAPVTPATTADSGASLASLAALSTDQVSQGLKEALAKGLRHAVASLGQPGGFMTNLNVKIPLPAKLQTVEKGLRTIGQGQLADQSIATMNQAAEQAVPVAADVFASGLKNMSIEDAKSILSGAPDAATQFFRRTTETKLRQKFMPIVQQSMTKCGATAAYEQLLGKAQSTSPFFSAPSLDLNAYVTDKAMDGLFKMVADEEKQIRANPVARSTDLLKSVFGALGK